MKIWSEGVEWKKDWRLLLYADLMLDCWKYLEVLYIRKSVSRPWQC